MAFVQSGCPCFPPVARGFTLLLRRHHQGPSLSDYFSVRSYPRMAGKALPSVVKKHTSSHPDLLLPKCVQH